MRGGGANLIRLVLLVGRAVTYHIVHNDVYVDRKYIMQGGILSRKPKSSSFFFFFFLSLFFFLYNRPRSFLVHSIISSRVTPRAGAFVFPKKIIPEPIEF